MNSKKVCRNIDLRLGLAAPELEGTRIYTDSVRQLPVIGARAAP